jgi:uncharacterized cupredoxin-like copper-binding protein
MAPRTRSGAAAGITVMAAALTLTGCGSSGSSSSSPTPATPSATSSATSSATAPASSSASASTAVTATETDFAIALSQSTFHPGAYTFTVVNQGQAPHNLAIQGPGIPQVVSQTVQNGATTKLTVQLQGGSYELWCAVDAHKDKGMDLTIAVG